MQLTVRQALVANFLGGSPDWYKFTVVAFLLINPLVAFSLGMFAAGWLLIAEFIFGDDQIIQRIGPVFQ